MHATRGKKSAGDLPQRAALESRPRRSVAGFSPTSTPMPPTCRTPSPSGAGSPPHILHIVADDLGYDDVGYHNAALYSPHLDELRHCGVHLDQFYSFKTCGPSRASLLAGRYPFRMGIYENADIDTYGMPINFTLLPELLRRAGYSTHAVGKWHAGYRTEAMAPTRRGFDSFFGYWHCCSDYFAHTFPDLVPSVSTQPLLDLARATRGGGPPSADFGCAGEYSTFLYANESTRIIRAHDARRSLYLYLAFQAVHGPLQVPEHFVRGFSRRLAATAAGAGGSDHARLPWTPGRLALGGMVSAMDAGVGHVIAALRGSKMWDRTLCLFHSDNGGAVGMHDNGPFRGGKFGLWEGGVRVTAVLGGPVMHADHRGAGRTWSGLGHFVDVLPTLLSAAAVQVPNATDGSTGPTPLDGISLWDAIRANGSSPRREVVHQVLNQYNVRDCYGADHDAQSCGAAIRVGRWKLLAGYPGDSRGNEALALANATVYDKWVAIQRHGGRQALAMPRGDGCHILTGVGCRCWRATCLFDVQADPGELRDRSRDKPEVVAHLLRRLAAVSATASTERVALCGWKAQNADRRALHRSLAVARAYVPYAAETPWLNDQSAAACPGVGESSWWYDEQPPPWPPYDLQEAARELVANSQVE